MKKLPRDLTGSELVKMLKPLGYTVTRQLGSHTRLTTQENGEHYITVPNHSPLKIGTLSAILKEIAGHFVITKEALIEKI